MPIHDYVNENLIAQNFIQKHECLTECNLIDFEREYALKGKEGGAKFSERVFAYWLYVEFNKIEQSQIEYIPHFRKLTRIDGVSKNYDFVVKTQRATNIFEFKCNIDMVEKDIFKFFISDPNANRILLIWEAFDNSLTSSCEEGSYLKLLKFAKSNEWLTDYFYLPVYKDRLKKNVNDKIGTEINRLIDCIRRYNGAADQADFPAIRTA